MVLLLQAVRLLFFRPRYQLLGAVSQESVLMVARVARAVELLIMTLHGVAVLVLLARDKPVVIVILLQSIATTTQEAVAEALEP